MAETAEEKVAREKKERVAELKNDPRHGDLRIMMLDIFETDIIPAFKDKPNKSDDENNFFDFLFKKED